MDENPASRSRRFSIAHASLREWRSVPNSQDLGRIERTLFTLDWLQKTELRRRVHVGLNKGEAKNALAKAVTWNARFDA
jgi:TnpA family transposase